MTRIAYFLSHPIQYQIPMIKRINKETDLELKVFYCTDISTRSYFDSGFGMNIQWDIPLLDGYDYEFLPRIVKRSRFSFANPFNYGIRRLLKSGNFDAVWLHGCSRLIHWQTILAARSLGLKILIRDEAWEKSRKRSFGNLVFKKLFYRLLNCFVDAFLCIGICNRDYYLYNHIRPEKIFSAPYVVDNDFFNKLSQNADLNELRNELAIKEDAKIILYASKLSARKRILDLILAYKKLIRCKFDFEVYLVVVGSGELENQARQMVSESGLQDGVRFAGFKNQTELPAYYALADVFVLPSENEPWGLAVNEAMSCSTAVVVSDEVGAAYDLVKDGINGFMFETGNIEDLSDKLSIALRNSHKMGDESLKIINQWSFEQVVSGLKAAITYVSK